MDIAKIKELVKILENSSLAEIEIQEEHGSIRLKKPDLHAPAQITYAAPIHRLEDAHAAPAHPSSPSPAVEANIDELEDDLVTIDSPMVGTFYAAPAPGEAPFAKIGDEIEEGQTVCIVEAMKLMNEVTAKFKCRIERVLVENGEPVEYGQALFAVQTL